MAAVFAFGRPRMLRCGTLAIVPVLVALLMEALDGVVRAARLPAWHPGHDPWQGVPPPVPILLVAVGGMLVIALAERRRWGIHGLRRDVLRGALESLVRARGHEPEWSLRPGRGGRFAQTLALPGSRLRMTLPATWRGDHGVVVRGPAERGELRALRRALLEQLGPAAGANARGLALLLTLTGLLVLVSMVFLTG